LNLQLLNPDGTPAGSIASINVEAGGQISRFISELITGMPETFQGVVKLTASAPIGVIGFRTRSNTRGDFLISATPPTSEAMLSGNGEMLFPYVVNGGGFTTEILP
jgi:hypothetical protein